MSLSTFMYHDIREVTLEYFPKRYELKSFITPDNFRKQILHIKRNYSIISPLEMDDVDLDSGTYAIISFDDGLSDHYNYGYETLKEFGLSGVFFIPVEAVSERIMFHSHKIQFILSATNEKDVVEEVFATYEREAERFKLPETSKSALWDTYKTPLVSDSWWTEEMIFITRFFREHGFYDFRDQMLCQLFRKYVCSDEKKFTDDFYLNMAQIKEMISNNMVIGGHGYHSINMKNEIEDIQTSEIVRTHEFLKEQVFDGSDFTLFYSYPNGGYTNHSLNLLSTLNCKGAFTTEKKVFTGAEYLKIPRFDATIDLETL